MSISETSGAQPSAEVELLAEEHWRTKDDSITRPCRNAVERRPAALRSVSHFSRGAHDFVVRPLDASPLAAVRGAESEPVDVESRPGRHLVLCVEDLDRSLQGLGTGELMRVVVGTASGGMFCGRIRVGQYLVGLTLSGDRLAELDNALSNLVLDIRRNVYHLPNEHLGGERGGSLPRMADGEGLHFETGLSVDDAGLEDGLRDVWQHHVNPVDLQYAACFRDWAMVCTGDAFDDPGLSPRFLGTATQVRRAMYRDVASRLRSDIARLRHALHPVTREPIDRLVLDVQEGAVYIHWLGRGPGTFLLGVTVDQLRVEDAEKRLTALLSRLRPLLPPLP